MRKVHNYAAWIMGVLVAILLIYTGYAILFITVHHTNDITVNSITVNGEDDVFKRGEVVDIHYNVCSKHSHKGKIQYFLVGKNGALTITKFIGYIDRGIREGCAEFTGMSISIPEETKAGEYFIRIETVYHIDGILGLDKDVTTVQETENFYVVNEFAI